jgi:hypothetical protein
VIVSDDEDLEVAIEYATKKGETKVKFYKRKRDYAEDTPEEIDLSKVTNLTMYKHNSLKQVADTVSVEGDDDNSELSEGIVEELKEDDFIENDSEPSDRESEFTNRMNANIQDTVSRECSVYIPEEEEKIISKKSDQIIPNVGESFFSEKEEEPEEDSKFVDQFDIIRSHIKEYVHKEDENVEQEIEMQSEEINDFDNSERVDNSDEKEEHVEQAIPQPLHQELLAKSEEDELLEMNSAAAEKAAEKHEAQEHVQQIEPIVEPKVEPIVEPIVESIVEKVEIKEEQDVEQKQEEEKNKDFIEESKDAEKIEESEEFKDEPRLSVSVSVAKANIIKERHQKKISFINRAIENFNFAFNTHEKKLKIAQVEEVDEEKSKDHVISCKPGKLAKRRWRVVNNSSIRWPKNTVLECQDKEVEVEIPEITNPLQPGDKLDISINIKIKEDEKQNIVKVFVFRFYNKIFGHFGEPLIATVEVVPDVIHAPALSQEEQLMEFLEGEEFNPALYEIANDFVEEGLGNFDQCLDALIQCRANYEEARQKLENQK